MEKSFTQEIGRKPVTIRWSNESEFVIETSNEIKNEILPTIASLCFSQYNERVEVEKFARDKINQSKGLIYIHNYNIPHVDDYSSEVKKSTTSRMYKKKLW